MSTKRNKRKNKSVSSDYKSMLTAMESAAKSIMSGHATRDLIARARVRGIIDEPSRSRVFINDLFGAELALRAAAAKRKRGINIIMHGPPHDPMQRPGTPPVYRGVRAQMARSPASATALPPSSAKPAPTSITAPATLPEPPLLTKDGDVLEFVEDAPSPCPQCRARGYLVDGPGETRPCDLCEGHGCLPVPD
jgi:hypothetical protein